VSRDELSRTVTLLLEVGNQLEEHFPPRKQLFVTPAEAEGELPLGLGAIQSDLADLLLCKYPSLVAVQGCRQFVPAFFQVRWKVDCTEGVLKEAE
jgi:hypothetical protein